jgi:hypothetical protein
VLYNPETDGQRKDPWLGLEKVCRNAGLNNDVTWHTFRLVWRLGGGCYRVVTRAEPVKKPE